MVWEGRREEGPGWGTHVKKKFKEKKKKEMNKKHDLSNEDFIILDIQLENN